MTTPFLEYELLSPETVDPVIMRITGQRERGFKEFRASNGVTIDSTVSPSDYYHYKAASYGMRSYPKLWIGSETPPYDDIRIPLADWPAVKQAIGELNEYMKEKDMISDRYEFDMKEWEYNTEPEPFETTGPAKLIVRRKKPKVKVEYCLHEGYKSTQYGQYHIVQFRVTGEVAETYVKLHPTCGEIDLARKTEFRDNPCKTGYSRITIGVDARDKWSAPVLLPESIFSRLDEITKALESKANEVKG